MQCPSCLCSTSEEVIINTTKYYECTYCGNLMSTQESIDNSFKDHSEELKMLRVKLEEANNRIDALTTVQLNRA